MEVLNTNPQTVQNNIEKSLFGENKKPPMLTKFNDYVPEGKNPELPTYRGRIGIIQGWISIFINLLLFIIKLF